MVLAPSADDTTRGHSMASHTIISRTERLITPVLMLPRILDSDAQGYPKRQRMHARSKRVIGFCLRTALRLRGSEAPALH